MSFEERIEEIVKARAALEERCLRPRKATGTPPKLIDPNNLTKKQQMEYQAWEIMTLKDKGKSHQQIAWELGISKRTVLYRIAALKKTMIPIARNSGSDSSRL